MSGERAEEQVLLPQVGGVPTGDGATPDAHRVLPAPFAPGFSGVASHQGILESRGRSERKSLVNREDGRLRERSRRHERPPKTSELRRPLLETEPKKPRLETTSEDELMGAKSKGTSAAELFREERGDRREKHKLPPDSKADFMILLKQTVMSQMKTFSFNQMQDS